jgi:two-component system sensor histidine kinase YesM
MSDNSGYFTKSIKGVSYLTVYDKSPNIGWTIAGIAPIDGMLLLSKDVRDYIYTLSILLITLGILIIYILSYFFTKRLSRLTDEMMKISTGVLDDIQLDMKSSDEIGEMNKVFQRMMRKLRNNIDEISEIKSKEFSFKIKALQAQINPHFMYNTLSTINWMAIDIGADNISQVVNALGKYYRIALSNGKEIITVKDELEHIKHYVYIQQIRVKEHIDFQFVVDAEALSYATPKMILQPIVENSVVHGIEKCHKTGKVVISVHKKGNIILYQVEDDGMGVDESVLHMLVSGNLSSSGYGLYNINMRIKLYFGDEFGLHIRSKPGEGTKVTVAIPAITQLQAIEAGLC